MTLTTVVWGALFTLVAWLFTYKPTDDSQERADRHYAEVVTAAQEQYDREHNIL